MLFVIPYLNHENEIKQTSLKNNVFYNKQRTKNKKQENFSTLSLQTQKLSLLFNETPEDTFSVILEMSFP